MRYRETRWPCDFPIRITGPAGVMRGVILNISPNGARLDAPELGRGDRVSLDLHPSSLSAHVRWARAGRCGLRFDHPISARELARIRGIQTGPAPRTRLNPQLTELR